jgi:membrane protein
VQGRVEAQLASLLGREGATAIREMLANANRPGSGGVLPTLLGVAGLLFGATGAFIQLQSALNTAWDVKPDPRQGGVKNFITKRLLSLGMLLAVGFLVLVSLALSALLSSAGGSVERFLPESLSGPLLAVINLVVSFAVITLLFAAIYKVLPDAVIQWRYVWIGAAVTALLFVVGKFLIGFYIGQSEPGDAYGAAGSLAVILVWIYYASMIVLLGAEFTQVYARAKGAEILPEPGAVQR